MFFGRSEEMKEIRYYLDHAKAADRPINIALLGERAAGKTSILNITEIEAKLRGCCTARIDLDEDDGASQMTFFYKVFDGIFTGTCQMGAFGGLTGKTFETYLNAVSSFVVPEDKLFCPFLFPIQFATAMKAGNGKAPVSDHAVKHDLMLIASELKRPMVVLFDESNVLAQSRVLLEKIRNIFMNIPGYMLVLTGTPDLFPIMDDVFSPIVRQFKKISVKEFDDENETENCVRKPLQKFSIPIEVSKSEISDIHELSGGRPYEIQLICHLLFRRIQAKRANRMRLDLALLEELRRELERSQDISGRKVLSAVMSLGRKQLQALGILTQCDGRASFEQLWNMHYSFDGTGTFTRNQLEDEFKTLKAKGILTDTENLVSFAGDAFDSLYVKYVAAEQKIRISVQPLPLDLALMIGTMQFMMPTSEFHAHFGIEAWTAHSAAAKLLTSDDPSSDPFAESQTIADDLYFQMIDFRKRGEIPVLFVSISLSGAATAALVTPAPASKEDALERLKKNLGSVKSRVENVSGTLIAERRTLPVAGVDRLTEKVLRTENAERRKRIARGHAARLAQAWLHGRTEEAALHANLAFSYNPTPMGTAANNLGYFFMATGLEERAHKMFELALEAPEDPDTNALANYNLAILAAKRGENADSRKRLEGCLEILREVPEEERKAGCIQVPVRDPSGKIEFRETSCPDLAAACEQAMSTLEGYRSQ
jgi:hypothetical protein